MFNSLSELDMWVIYGMFMLILALLAGVVALWRGHSLRALQLGQMRIYAADDGDGVDFVLPLPDGLPPGVKNVAFRLSSAKAEGMCVTIRKVIDAQADARAFH